MDADGLGLGLGLAGAGTELASGPALELAAETVVGAGPGGSGDGGKLASGRLLATCVEPLPSEAVTATLARVPAVPARNARRAG